MNGLDSKIKRLEKMIRSDAERVVIVAPAAWRKGGMAEDDTIYYDEAEGPPDLPEIPGVVYVIMKTVHHEFKRPKS